jgi:AraC family transcriptional regulator
MGRSMRGTSSGRILIWQGGSIWIGETRATTGLHAHHAIQITLALEGEFRLRDPATPDFGEGLAAAIIAANRPHAFTAEGTVALVFVEPESVDGLALQELHCRGAAISRLSPAQVGESPALLRDAYRSSAGREHLEEIARGMIAQLRGGAVPKGTPDPRVLRAIRMLADRTDDPPTLGEAAAAVGLSPGRFRHLFVAETGLPHRGYVLWLRLGRAVDVFAAGGSLTDAAHDAGFADSAHLSRTFRRMFGLAPSSLNLM